MLQTNRYKCETLEEVKIATEKLDKAIEVCPLKFDVGGVEHETHNWKGIYNISKGVYTKTVSKNLYQMITHKDFLNAFMESLNNLNIKFKVNIQSTGNTVVTDIEFTEKKQVFKELGEEFISGIRLINSYDRNFPVTIMPRLVRLACLNGMVLSRDETRFNVKHSSQLVKEIEKLISVKINQILNKYQDMQVMVENCIADSIEWKIACTIISKLIQQPKHIDKILEILNITRIVTPNIKDKKNPTITYLGPKYKDTDVLTRWQIYNAITQYATHGEQLTTYLEMHLQNKAEKILLTPLLKMVN